MTTAATSASEDELAHCQHSHVHFNPEQVSHHDLEIIVEAAGPDVLDIHLGFLQVGHVYSIDVPIAHRLGRVVRNCGAVPPNPYIRLTSHRPGVDSGSEADVFCFELFAHKERLMRETLVLSGVGAAENPEAAQPPALLTLQFHARVLGRLKGTPALKNGIKCIGMNSEEDESCSEVLQPGYD